VWKPVVPKTFVPLIKINVEKPTKKKGFLEVTPRLLDLGDVPVSSEKCGRFVVSNTSNLPLNFIVMSAEKMKKKPKEGADGKEKGKKEGKDKEVKDGAGKERASAEGTAAAKKDKKLTPVNLKEPFRFQPHGGTVLPKSDFVVEVFLTGRSVGKQEHALFVRNVGHIEGTIEDLQVDL
jgi:hypothetical protein